MSDVHPVVHRAVAALGGAEYTKRDAARTLLGYADLTRADGSVLAATSPTSRP